MRHLRFRVISVAGNGLRVQRHMMGLAIGTAVLFVLAGTLGVLQADRAVAPLGGGSSALSGAQLVRWIAPELSYWSAHVQASDNGKTWGGSLLHLLVGVDPSRPRTFLSRELRGMPSSPEKKRRSWPQGMRSRRTMRRGIFRRRTQAALPDPFRRRRHRRPMGRNP
uniref:hypothetical protein n=1 Tax=Calditerricola satsumensis TaxID=373054 RepID=UPI0012EE8D07